MQDPDQTVETNSGLGLDLPPKDNTSPTDDATSPVEHFPPVTNEASSFTPSSVPSGPSTGPSTGLVDEATRKAVDHVLYSDIGVNTLLTRLKQSIASVRDFSTFLKERSNVEDEHAKKLRRMCKTTFQNIRSADSRQGSYAQQFEAVTTLHERMADNGLQFSLNLHQMHEDLNQLAYEMEKGRKHWKATGLSAEQRVQDAERQLDKAKQKYDSLAEDYDHAKTGDKSGRHFGLRGPKSGAQYEEDLLKKLQFADKDYQSKVQYAQQERQQLITTGRPQAVKTMQELISECDAGLALQFQKFAIFSEKLLLGNGILMSPLNDQDGPQQRSMRDMISQIDNQQDFHSYVRSFSGKVPANAPEIEYKKHPTLMPLQQTMQQQQPVRQHEPQLPPQPLDQSPPRGPQASGAPSSQPPPQFPMAQYSPDFPKQNNQGPPTIPPQSFDGPGGGFEPQRDRVQQQPHRGPHNGQSIPLTPSGPGRGYGGPPPQQYSQGPGQPPYGNSRGPYPNGPGGNGPMGMGMGAPPMGSNAGATPSGPMQHQQPPTPTSRDRNGGFGRGGAAYSAAPVKPVFGITLEDLFLRDQSPVPKVVYECINAVSLFGLEHEGIYRISGNTVQVQELKALFNNDSSRVDFRNPETFYHDVNNPANLLKQFLRELPDPLLTTQQYEKLIDAARIQDDLVRRDNLHAIINDLPDPNYATLRAVVLHLHKVDQHSDKNRMTPMNLSVVFAPTLMGPHIGDMVDASLQPKVVETILVNALQIFDED